MFRLEVRFCTGLRNNLFGRDWMEQFCLAFDRETVHLLAG